MGSDQARERALLGGRGKPHDWWRFGCDGRIRRPPVGSCGPHDVLHLRIRSCFDIPRPVRTGAECRNRRTSSPGSSQQPHHCRPRPNPRGSSLQGQAGNRNTPRHPGPPWTRRVASIRGPELFSEDRFGPRLVVSVSFLRSYGALWCPFVARHVGGRPTNGRHTCQPGFSYQPGHSPNVCFGRTCPEITLYSAPMASRIRSREARQAGHNAATTPPRQDSTTNSASWAPLTAN